MIAELIASAVASAASLRLLRPLLFLVVLFCSLLIGAQRVAAAPENSAGPSAQIGDPAVDDGGGFVPVSLDNRETVSGKKLMIAAYGVIFGLLILYVFSILRREKKVDSFAQLVEKNLKK